MSKTGSPAIAVNQAERTMRRIKRMFEAALADWRLWSKPHYDHREQPSVA